MVLMRVGDHNTKQRRVGSGESSDRLQFKSIWVGHIEREAHIEDEPLVMRLDLDAGAADLPGASMDADSHDG